MLRIIIAFAAFTVLHCSAEESDRQFVARCTDGRFEVVFDQMAMPPLIIREVGTNRLADLCRVFPSRFIFVRGYKRSTQRMVGK